MSRPIAPSQASKVHNNGHTAPAANSLPDVQVSARATRRRFPADYKRRIIKEADTCTQPGEIGQLLRREGLYASTLASFRKQLAEGKLVDKDPKRLKQQRNQRAAERMRQSRRLAQLEAENKKLKVLLELQKKVAALMDLSLTETDNALT
jgi:transposase